MNYGRMSEWDRGDRGGDTGAGAQAPERSVDTRSADFNGYGLRDLSGHRKKVNTVAWNSDGRRLASGAADKCIRVWTVEPSCGVARAERADAEYTSHTDTVTSVEWRPDHPDIMASASSSKADTNIRFHDARTNKPTAAVPLSCERNLSVAWSLDGLSLVVACSSDDLVVVDTRKMRKQKQWAVQGHVKLHEARWGPTPAHVTLALDDGSVRISPLQRLDSQLWRLQAHASHANCIAYSRDFKLLATGGSDALVTLWEVEDMICTRTFSRPDQSIRALALSADGRWLAYSSGDGPGTVDVVSTSTGELGASLQNLKSYPEGMAWCPSAPVLAFAGDETKEGYGAVSIWAPPKAASG